MHTFTINLFIVLISAFGVLSAHASEIPLNANYNVYKVEDIPQNYNLSAVISIPSCKYLCIRKCCKFGYYLEGDKKCVRDDATLKYTDMFTQFRDVQHGLVHCDKYMLEEPKDNFQILRSGAIQITGGEDYSTHSFCFDWNKNQHRVALVCFPEEMDEDAASRLTNTIGKNKFIKNRTFSWK